MNTGRIMKQPPGGQCHDLFGAEFKGSPCHHRVLKPPGGASSDIFGRPDEVDQSPRKIRSNHHLKSSVFGTHSTPEPPATSRSKPDGNPVTGEGYSGVANGEKESSSTQPAATTTNGTGSAEIRRNRVPPGGYSSGLW